MVLVRDGRRRNDMVWVRDGRRSQDFMWVWDWKRRNDMVLLRGLRGRKDYVLRRKKSLLLVRGRNDRVLLTWVRRGIDNVSRAHSAKRDNMWARDGRGSSDMLRLRRTRRRDVR